ncbi:hypothetical protein Prudu_283S000200, partial [Prunus dulcis]
LPLSSPPSALYLSSRFDLAATSAPSNRSPGHHTWGRSPGPVPNEPPLDGEPPPTQRRRCRGRNRPEIAMEADGSVRTSSLIFSSNSPPNRSSKAPGARQNCKGDLRGVEAVEVRGIHHRAILSFRVSSQAVEVRGIHHRAILSFRVSS